jgi:ATP-dependent Clp endopeptidase proteolytic subunit ClpP
MQNIIKIDPRIKAKHSDLHVEPHVVRLVEGFNEETSELFHEDFEKALNKNKKIIPVVIDSYGGQVYSLMQCISIIKSSPLPVATICTGKAMSCGAMLFMFGTEGLRFMTEQATLMIHEVSSFTIGKVEEIKADAKEVDRLNNLIFTMAAKHIGKSPKYFLDMLHKHNHAEIYLTAENAKKNNICNHIGMPQIITEVKVKQKIVVNGKQIEF